jgi:small conductance mechanosensitive channel
VKIIGVGALVAAIAGGVAGGAAGVALGGFIGLVVGFASQQVLGQAIAGLFILITRPLKIGDKVVLGGDEGIVEDVSTLFTTIVKPDGVKVLIPNNSGGENLHETIPITRLRFTVSNIYRRYRLMLVVHGRNRCLGFG